MRGVNASSRSVVHMRPSTTATDQKNQDRRQLPVLQYLQRQLDGSLVDGDVTHMQYPTAISQPLNFRIVAIGEATATIELEADAVLHGSQQGTATGAFHANWPMWRSAQRTTHRCTPEKVSPASNSKPRSCGLSGLPATRRRLGRAPGQDDQPQPVRHPERRRRGRGSHRQCRDDVTR